jgi:membrane-associated phospholipid phosphatase
MQVIKLKQFMNHKNKFFYIPVLATVFMTIYSVCGAISNQYPNNLEMTSFEQGVPFLVWTVWIYIGLYPAYILWAVLGYKDEIEMNKTLYAFSVLCLVSCSVFLIYPVTYPRELFPLPSETGASVFLLKMTRLIDKPSNCLPSLHVGLCFIFAFGYWEENKRKFWISIFLSALISFSTLTTKQHYLVDIIASLVIASSIYLFFRKFVVISQTSSN